MKQFYPLVQPRRSFLVYALAAPVAALSFSCHKPGSKAVSFNIGERATAGSLIYTVSDTEWKPNLGEGATARVPRHKFMVMRVSVTNGGGSQIAVPLLSLYDAEGKQYRELDDIEGVPGWLGALRMLAPVETRAGFMVFDVPVGSYKLQVTDGGDIEKEVVAYVDVPLRMESSPVLAEPSVTK